MTSAASRRRAARTPYAMAALFYATAALLGYVAASSVAWHFEPTSRAIVPGPVYLVAAVGLGVAASLLARDRSPLDRIPTRMFVAGLLVTFVGTRSLWVGLVPTEPVNDFRVLHNLAGRLSTGRAVSTIDNGDWPIFMYSWGFAVLLGWIYAAFGNAVIVAKLFNVALGSLTIWALYAWMRTIASERASRAAALMFLCWPTQLTMTNVVAAEHVSLAAAVTAFWLLSASLSRRAGTAGLVYWARWLCAGALCAVAYLTRFPLLVALIAGLLTLTITRGLTRRCAAEASAMVAGFVLVNVAFIALLSTVYQVRLPARSVAGNLLVGVNVDSDGAWNADDHGRFVRFATMEEANEWAMQESLRRIRSAPAATFRLAVRKAANYWRTDEYGVWWGVQTSVPPEIAASSLAPLVQTTALYHTGVLVLGAAGALRFVIRAPRDARWTLVAAPILGSTMLHSILEVQTRYHYPFEPLVFALAAIAVCASPLCGGYTDVPDTSHRGYVGSVP